MMAEIRTIKEALFTGLLMLAMVFFSIQPARAAEFSGDLTMSVGGQTMQGKVYVQGCKQRVEVRGPRGLMAAIVDTKKKTVWTLLPSSKKFLQTRFAPAKGADALLLGKKALPKDAVKIMTEKVSGYECDVYRIKSGAAGEVQVWMARKLDYPVKTTGVDRRGGEASSLISNIKEGKVIDSLFSAPGDYTSMPAPKK